MYECIHLRFSSVYLCALCIYGVVWLLNGKLIMAKRLNEFAKKIHVLIYDSQHKTNTDPRGSTLVYSRLVMLDTVYISVAYNYVSKEERFILDSLDNYVCI